MFGFEYMQSVQKRLFFSMSSMTAISWTPRETSMSWCTQSAVWASNMTAGVGAGVLPMISGPSMNL